MAQRHEEQPGPARPEMPTCAPGSDNQGPALSNLWTLQGAYLPAHPITGKHGIGDRSSTRGTRRKRHGGLTWFPSSLYGKNCGSFKTRPTNSTGMDSAAAVSACERRTATL